MQIIKKSIFFLIFSIIFLISITDTFAYGVPVESAVFPGGYRSSAASNIKYIIYCSDSKLSSLMTAAANSWNGCHPRVKLSYNSSSSNMSLIKGSSLEDGVCGVMNAYYNGALGLSIDYDLNDIWAETDCIIYDNHCLIYGYNSDWDRQSILAHEIGHALSLAHQEDGQVSVMAQHTNYNTKYLYPQRIDIDNLKLKWGY
jgi:hypothetical protein